MLKIILHKTKPVKRNIGGEEIVRILGPIFCAAFFYLLILFGVRIAEFVISIIKIISEFKFFYLLSILSFIVLNFIFIFIILFKKGIKLIQLLLIITLSSFYIIEGTSFFLYVYEVRVKIYLILNQKYLYMYTVKENHLQKKPSFHIF